jgi:ryanodine receptor 2
LKFSVILGESVEENANLIVRLLIRRPDCLGPALRGEGGGLLFAIVNGIRMSLQIAATQNMQNPIVLSAVLDSNSSPDFLTNSKFDFSRTPLEDDEDYIDTGGAILSFYTSLVELLGRCAPSEDTIKMGKSDSIRVRSILKSLVSMEDLLGVLAIRFILPIPSQPALNENLPGIQPIQKMSIVLFLERVYGIPDEHKFFELLETAFLPDIRCATTLDAVKLNFYI